MTKGEHMHRMAWLVDIGYVARASADHFRLDYVAAERLLEEAFGPAQTFLFNGYDSLYGIPEGLQAFYDAMQRHGMVLQLHPMQPGPPGQTGSGGLTLILGRTWCGRLACRTSRRWW